MHAASGSHSSGASVLRSINIRGLRPLDRSAMRDFGSQRHWLPIEIAPDDCDLQLGERHKSGVVPWTFPCRRKSGVWFNAWTAEPVLICPTHWRIWRP